MTYLIYIDVTSDKILECNQKLYMNSKLDNLLFIINKFLVMKLFTVSEFSLCIMMENTIDVCE